MDKCKYYLKENGTTLMFESDAELTKFIKNNSSVSTNENFEFVIETYDKPWRSNSNKSNRAISIALSTKEDQKFELVKDIEDNYYSVHFKTTLGSLDENEKAALFQEVANNIPFGGKLSTHTGEDGAITKGGISGINQFLKYGFKLSGETREVRYVNGSKIQIPILVKSISKDFIKYSKTGEGLETPQELIGKAIKKLNHNVDKTFVLESEFMKKEHVVDGKLRLLSPYMDNDNYKKEAVRELVQTKYSDLAKINPDEATMRAEIEIEKDLEFDNQVFNLSKPISKIMSKLIGNFNIEDKGRASIHSTEVNIEFDNIINIVLEYNKKKFPNFEFKTIEKAPGIIESQSEAIARIKNTLKDKFLEHYNSNYKNSSSAFLSNLIINRQQSISGYPGIVSFASLVSVDPTGTPDIYEFKVSRNEFSDWHSAKKLRADYKLGLNRQLLEDVIPTPHSTKMSSLYILPIIFPTNAKGLIEIDEFHFSSLEERSSSLSKTETNKEHRQSLLADNGEITRIMRQLFPSKIKENPEESDKLIELNSRILGAMFPKYNFRSKSLNENWERAAKKAIENSTNFPKYRFYDAINAKQIEEDKTVEGEEKFKQRVKEYFKLANANKDSELINIVKKIKQFKKDNDIIMKGVTSDSFKKTFGKYLDSEWEIIDTRPELFSAGVIIFKNNLRHTFELISITVNSLNQINNLGLGNSLLGKYYTNAEVKNDDKIWEASTSHIEIMKALTILNSNPDLLKGYSLADIKVYDNSTGLSDWTNNMDKALYNFDLLLKAISKDIKVENNFKSKKITKLSQIDIIFSNMKLALSKLNDKKIESKFNLIEKEDLSDNKQRLNHFLELKKLLRETYPTLEKYDFRTPDYSKPEVYLDVMLSLGIIKFSNIEADFDYNIPSYGMSLADSTHLIKSVLFGSAPDFDSKNRKVVGFAQGALFSSNGDIPSEYISKLNDIISIGQNKITETYNKFKNKTISVTNQMYKELGRSNIEKELIGNADKHHEVFFEKHNGKITNDFKLKNPWDSESSKTLNTLQIKYLKKYIHLFYLNSRFANKDLNDFDQFEKSEELQTLLATGDIDKILKMPIIKKQSLTDFKSLTTDGFRKFIGNTWDSILNSIDFKDQLGSEADEEQKIGAYNSINGFGKIYNKFDSQQSEEYRNSLVDKYGVSHFEINLDTLILKYAFENIRENYMNQILPIIDSGIQTMKFYGSQTGRVPETEKAIETFLDKLKISVFNVSPIKGTEGEDFFNIVRAAQRATSFMTIALRPVSLIKELVVGTIKNVSFAWSKIYGDESFEMEHLTKAYSLLFSKDDYLVVSELNNMYRFANRDLNQIVDKTKVDRRGINFLSNLMYWSNTAPDYINRLALFLAKMEKDGCYKAHYLDEEGNLIYDPRKDDRYSYYLNKRESYNFKEHSSDTKYNDQRSLYLTTMDMFNAEMLTDEQTILTEKDMLPSAYSNAERESIKTFSETAYGYYDHERSPLIKHLPLGIMFGQYMTFWPAKVKYYFGKPDSKSKRGHMSQKIDLETKEKIYVKYGIDDDGSEIRLEVLESQLKPGDARSKAYEWVGDPSEGLMYSLGMTIRELITVQSLEGVDPQRLKNSKVMLHDLLMAMIAILLGIILYSKHEDFGGGKSGGGGATSTWSEMGQYEKIATKIIMRSTKEFNPFGLLTDLQATPAFISSLSDATTDFKNLFSGKSSVESFFRNNLNFLEVIPKPMLR